MFRTATLVAISVLAVACTPPAAKNVAENESIALTTVTLFADDNGKPGSEVGKFDYRQKTLHFRASLTRPLKEAKGRWIFTAKSTSAGNNQAIQSLDGVFDGADMAAQISLEKAWPVGIYHVDILAEDKPLGGFDFEVTGEKSTLAFRGHSLATDDGKGLPGTKVDTFKSTDRTMHIQVTTKGIDTTEPEVIWRLFHKVKDKAFELGNTIQPRRKLQDSVLTCKFTSPKDWEKGEYWVDISLEGKKVHTIPIVVK